MTFNETWEGDKGYFWDKHSARLDEMDENATDPRIEILPTFTDSDGVVWQMPHDSGWARVCFDALMSKKLMIAKTKHPSKYKMERGQMVACEWEEKTVIVTNTLGGWCIGLGKVEFYPATETHRVFVMAVGLRYDFSGVVLC